MSIILVIFKNIIIVVLCLTIIFLCVGFALLSKELENVKNEKTFIKC